MYLSQQPSIIVPGGPPQALWTHAYTFSGVDEVYRSALRQGTELFGWTGNPIQDEPVRYGDWYLLPALSHEQLDRLRFLTLLRISGGPLTHLRSYLSLVEFAPVCQELQHRQPELQISPAWLLERELVELYRPAPARDYLVLEHTQGADLERALQAYGLAEYRPTGRRLEQLPPQAVPLKGRPRAWQLAAVYPRA